MLTKLLRSDMYMRVALGVIAISLALIAIRPSVSPTTVQAQSPSPNYYIEPGYTMLFKPGGGVSVVGKMVVDLNSGDIWGFATAREGPYPMDHGRKDPPVVKPMYLGRFDFSQMHAPQQ